MEAGETRPESKQDVLDVYCLLRRALLDTLANSCSRGMHGDDDGGGDISCWFLLWVALLSKLKGAGGAGCRSVGVNCGLR